MTVILVVVGALGAITTEFEKCITDIGVDVKIKHAQTAASLETTKILRLALGCQISG